MKIIQINNHHRNLGGTERYYLDLSQLLVSKGHEVAHFSMRHPQNIPSKWQKFFVERVSFNNGLTKKLHPLKFTHYCRLFASAIKKLVRVLYSFESAKKLDQLIIEFRPDIIHIHNIYFYLTPSILTVCLRHHIPVVHTVHDYHLISPNFILFCKDRIDESTKPSAFYKALFTKSIGNSFIGSVIAVLNSYLNHYTKIYQRTVQVFITPSKFMAKKMREYNFSVNSIQHVPNFTRPPSKDGAKSVSAKKKFVLFFGSLSTQKGVNFLLKVASQLPNVYFKLIGNFPDKSSKKEFNKQLKKLRLKNLTIIPGKNPSQLKTSIRESQFVIVPSLWFENQPYSVLESYAEHKPVVASRIGGLPEIVKPNLTGLLFKAGNIQDCSSKIKTLWENPELVKTLGENASVYCQTHFNPDNHYQKIRKIYLQAISQTNSKR